MRLELVMEALWSILEAIMMSVCLCSSHSAILSLCPPLSLPSLLNSQECTRILQSWLLSSECVIKKMPNLSCALANICKPWFARENDTVEVDGRRYC